MLLLILATAFLPAWGWAALALGVGLCALIPDF